MKGLTKKAAGFEPGGRDAFRATVTRALAESTVRDLLKHAALLVPVDPADDPPQVSLVEALDERQKQDLFLNVWSQIEQLHDLGHAGSRHPAEAGQFGIIPHRSIPHQPSNRMASAISRAIRGRGTL